MTKQAKTALIAALMMGTGALALSQPALAKKEEQAAPAMKLSPAFQKPAFEAQQKLQANDLPAAETALAQAEAAAKSDDEVYIAARLRLGLEQSKLKASSGGDAAKFAAGSSALLPAINKLIDSPKTPKEDVARFLEFRGNVYYDSKKYAEASADYERARAAGASDDDLSLQLMKSKGEAGDVNGAAAELQRQIAAQPAGKKVPDTWYRYVLAKLVKAKSPEAVTWSQKLVAAYPTPENWRQWVGVYASSISPSVKLDARQRLDLLRLLRAAKALADENDYNEYAQATDATGLFDETLSVINEGNANGKLSANNQLAKMLKTSSNTGLGLEKPIATQEAAARAAKTGDLAAQVADSYLGKGNYAKAAELYRVALGKGFEQPTGAATKRHFIDTDEVNTHLGIALALAGDKAGARAALTAVGGTPRKDIAGFWLTWIDIGSAAA